MTPLPKRRWSTRRQGKKRASQQAGLSRRESCSNCGQEIKISHRACPGCGFYRGKPVIIIKQKKGKSSKEA